MLTILAGLSSAFSYAASDLFSQKVTRRALARTHALWVLATGFLLVVPAALLLEGLPSGAAQWRSAAMATAAGVAYVGAFSCLLRGLRSGDLGLVSTLNALQGAYAVVVFVLLGEPLTAGLAAALALCLTGGLLTSFHDRTTTAAGAPWGLAAGLLFGAVIVCFSFAGDLGWLSQTAISRSASLALVLPFALVTGAVALPAGLPRVAVGAGALELAGLLLLTTSISLGPPTVAGVTTTQFGTFAVLLGYVILKERPRRHQWLGIVCTMTGVTVLAVLS